MRRCVVPAPGCAPGFAFALCACGCGQIATILDHQRRRRTGYRRGHGATRLPPNPCNVDGCEALSFSRGLCRKHYKRLRVHGDVHRGRVWATAAARFWLKAERPSEDACWPWRGAVAGSYGRFWTAQGREHGRPVQAHRFAYELLIGPIPDGLEIDHLCRNKLCVNPAHLEPVTGAENARRAVSARLGQSPKRLPDQQKGADQSAS